ncbi:MBL fold metallo-hydrolase [Deinococcus sedimenti]|uniref:MBL fold metallo-hydrolase n=1 Tax=Deinococcus sedimenti TaxID=1867090 RepID=UPI0016659238|nr:MBL fold metallo-hydrolase [Deinococcus sedimenti]
MLRSQVLGRPAEDNALWVVADSGQGQTRLLLDCGARVLDALPFAEVQATDHLLLSHLHMDHVGGFDDFFRATFDRPAPTHAWGPPGTARILGHRFQGFWWNHAPELRGQWVVHDVHDTYVQAFRFEAHETFAVAHDAGTRAHDGTILTTPEVTVQAVPLEHHGRSLGFILREPDRARVNTAALTGLGLRPGPWLAALKSGVTGQIDVNGQPHDADNLRAALLDREAGDSVAYLTDFLLDAAQHARLAPLLRDVQMLYAEAQYAPADQELATRHEHTTVTQVAALAHAAGVPALTLLHLSRRYRPEDWAVMLHAAQAIHPNAPFPDGWLDA